MMVMLGVASMSALTDVGNRRAAKQSAEAALRVRRSSFLHASIFFSSPLQSIFWQPIDHVDSLLPLRPNRHAALQHRKVKTEVTSAQALAAVPKHLQGGGVGAPFSRLLSPLQMLAFPW